jgi:hypothetical protein
MARPAMDVTMQPQSRRIQVHIDLKAQDVLDLFAFVLLVAAKFDGKLGPIGRFHRQWKPSVYYASLDITFDDAIKWADAKNHCANFLDDEGHVRSSYRGALDACDPKRTQSEDLLSGAKAAPSSN